MFKKILSLASPPVFYSISTSLSKVLFVVGFGLLIFGISFSITSTPTDSQQGDVYRVIYVHVPAAWMSMFLYVIACFYAVIFWVWRTSVSAVMMRALLPTGAWMTFLALVTGSLWGKPTWGTYWVWDARLTTELLLLFIYLGLIAIGNIIEDKRKTDKAVSLITIFGLFNIPLIYFSVIFWNTLHQGFSVGPTNAMMADEIKLALFICTLGFWFTCTSVILIRAKGLLLEREADSQWVKTLLISK